MRIDVDDVHDSVQGNVPDGLRAGEAGVSDALGAAAPAPGRDAREVRGPGAVVATEHGYEQQGPATADEGRAGEWARRDLARREPAGSDPAGGEPGEGGPAEGGRPAPLRVDAQRNLEHVLRAAREVFGELGYGAPMEDVARRARVGVGTVYRRFPSKHVLVQRIAQEETERLTAQARAALRHEEEPWPALARFLRTSAASGAGRLLPPEVLRVGVAPAHGRTEPSVADAGAAALGEPAMGEPVGAESVVGERRVPEQRRPEPTAVAGDEGASGGAAPQGLISGVPEAPAEAGPTGGGGEGEAGLTELLDVVGQLVRRAREAGDLRADVTVADMLLVISTAAPVLPDAEQQEQASDRLLEILLEGLRSRPAA
ncbi:MULTISPECIES: TetR/AcrR family transcriptional regulator [unclassified Streptomyces]|uniref:TetR/AcrR family transcriptional regulator n=1 Tax=unclassified Streptomyces TaxID=2593676 RepID=UPI0022B74078|nr:MULTISPECIES: helix-turn-helix domain-containing protein [unclassified Streptomyces]MCZ7417503.1 helix-turn-helix domain containing protein [Streptomyces sp. WMMC897]MCZ7432668.1 helix-turn-helix domain containing protein [Streptomyces sp. WMMC1477]